MPLPPLSNQFANARKILESLQQGIDPETNRELPKNSIVNNIVVNRAIALSVMAIDQIVTRMERRAQLPTNVGRSWSKEEERALVALYEAGTPVADIAVHHGRTVRAIEARLEHLGLLKAAERTTERTFFSQKKEGNENE